MTDQAATVMAEPDENDEHCCDSYYYISDFSFAFNNSIFSDRVLHIEVSYPVSIPTESHSLATTAPNSKRRRKHTSKADDILLQHEGSPSDITMVEESPSGDVSDGNDTSLGMNCYKVQRVRTIHISSVILAGKSRYFYKLFSNGMRESKQRNVTLRIHASEEDALMDLLSFIHSNTLSRTSPAALLDLLVVADKFEVASCIRYCSRMLTKLPMTCDIALLYLDLPLSIMMTDAIQPVINLAKLFLAKHYREITKFVDEVLNLPLAGLEAVLSSDDLQMASEDAVYDFVLKWARIHYPKVEERRDVLGSRLSRFIRFPYMSSHKLKKVLTCNDFHPDHASKVVFEALFFKADTPYRQRSIAAKNDGSAYHRYVERAYKFLPVNVVEFQLPRPRCFAYFDLKKEQCANLFPNSRFYSRGIPLGGRRFLLSAHCHMDPQNASHCFGLFVGLQDKGLISITVDYEFAARSKPGEEYIVRFKGNYTFTGGKVIGYRNLFGIPWDVFMADNSHYFINGILHLRAELSIR